MRLAPRFLQLAFDEFPKMRHVEYFDFQALWRPEESFIKLRACAFLGPARFEDMSLDITTRNRAHEAVNPFLNALSLVEPQHQSLAFGRCGVLSSEAALHF